MRVPELYLDASAITAIFVEFDAHHAKIKQLIGTGEAALLVSDFGAIEFVSALSRLTRVSGLGLDDARTILADFQSWIDTGSGSILLKSSDIVRADGYLRRFDSPLRAPDALHLAIADRTGAAFVTFDRKLVVCARVLGIPVIEADLSP